MKNVRIIYTKGSRMKFISHLDMTRFMTHMLRMSKLPIWYTEGFHPHAYITFALPLSLGFESDYEIMDIRLEDDSYPIEKICDELNRVFPEYVHALSAAEPVQKPGKIGFAKFHIIFADEGKLSEEFKSFTKKPKILCCKKTKSGAEKQIDLADKIKEIEFLPAENTEFSILLPAGGNENINPELILNTFFAQTDKKCPYSIRRTEVLNTEKQIFR